MSDSGPEREKEDKPSIKFSTLLEDFLNARDNFIFVSNNPTDMMKVIQIIKTYNDAKKRLDENILILK